VIVVVIVIVIVAIVIGSVFIVRKVVKRGQLRREGRVVEGEEESEVGVGAEGVAMGMGVVQQPVEIAELYAVVNKGPRKP
jgi:hypothetical protein